MYTFCRKHPSANRDFLLVYNKLNKWKKISVYKKYLPYQNIYCVHCRNPNGCQINLIHLDSNMKIVDIFVPVQNLT